MSLPVWLPGLMFLLRVLPSGGGSASRGVCLGRSGWMTFWQSDFLVLAFWLKIAFCYGLLFESGLLVESGLMLWPSVITPLQ